MNIAGSAAHMDQSVVTLTVLMSLCHSCVDPASNVERCRHYIEPKFKSVSAAARAWTSLVLE